MCTLGVVQGRPPFPSPDDRSAKHESSNPYCTAASKGSEELGDSETQSGRSQGKLEVGAMIAGQGKSI